MSFDFSSLITDRTQADVSRVEQIAANIKAGTTSESELAEFNSAAMKGAYNHTDLNRVTSAMEALKAKLEGYGYNVPGYQRIEIEHNPPPAPVVPGESRLPDGYLELTYIESTGTQYIDTAFKHNQNTRVVMDIQATSITDNVWAFEGRTSTTVAKHGLFFFYSDTKKWTSDYANSRKNFSDIGDTDRLHIDFDKNTCTINGQTVTHTASTFQSEYNLALLGDSRAGNVSGFLSAKLYSCQIYDNGTLIRDFVPCIDPSGNIGLFDVVNLQFYGNPGAGVFVAGDRVNVALPDGYKQLTYIESTGTQCIDTGFKPNQNTHTVLTAKFAQEPSDNVALFGTRVSNTNQFWWYWRPDESQFSFRFANTSTNNLTGGNVTARHTFDVNKNVFTVSGSSVTASGVDFQSEHNAFIFAVNSSGAVQYPSSMMVYSCQIYDNGVLVRDFVPCIDPGGNVGLYDLSTAAFFGNGGTGAFVAGAIIEELPEGYTKVEYLQSSGKQYIDTGFKPNQDTRIVLEADFPKNGSSATWFFGPEGWETSARYQLRITSSGTTYISDYGSQALDTAITPSGRTVFDRNKNIFTIGAVVCENKTATFQSSYNLRLFGGSNTSGTPMSSPGTIYSCRIYDNGTMIRDYVPCIDLNGTAGMYDMVNDVFYQNAGTDVFVTGEEIVSPVTKPVAVSSDDVSEYDAYTWYEFDWPTPATMTVYLLNVAVLRSILSVMKTTPEVPADMANLLVQEANNIEKILEDINLLLTRSAQAWYYSDDVFSGEG